MTPLRHQMIEAIRLRGFSIRTESSYVRTIIDLARYHRRSPDQLEPKEVQAYLRHLALERDLAPASCHLALSGIRFFYRKVLGQDDFDAELIVPKRKQQIPQLLTRAEVKGIIVACPNVKHRVALTVAYGCGLRISELVALRVSDIDSERRLMHIVQGKGGKDRMVIASAGLLDTLRSYWRQYRPKSWLFSGQHGDSPLAISSVQKAYTRAKALAKVEKVGGVHALRHAYATHQLEAGLPVHILQRLLGHSDMHSTLRYVHWVASYHDAGKDHCDLIQSMEFDR